MKLSSGFLPVLTTGYVNPNLAAIASEMAKRIIPSDVSEPLASAKSAGPPTPGATDNFIRFSIQPIPLATLTLLRSSPLLRAYVTPDVVSRIYLTLARWESGLDVGAEATTTSATGALQLIKDTYKFGVPLGTTLLKSCPLRTQNFLNSIFAILPPTASTGSWKVLSHDDPERDRTQYLAAAGVIYSELQTVFNKWKFTASGWRPQKGSSPRIDYLISHFGPTLAEREAGLQLLVTIHHIEGLSWLYNRGNWEPHHPSRFETDPTTYKSLAASTTLPGVLAGIDRLKVVYAESAGDPSAGGSETGFPFIFPLLVYLKKLVPTIRGKFGEKRKINKARGIYHSTHKGLDLRAAEGTPVLAVADGTITETSYNQKQGSWGKSIVLTLPDKTGYRYAHLSKVDVHDGQKVEKGQVLGKTGHTGVVEPHLHFEFYPKGAKASDPLSDPDHRWLISLKLT